MRFDPCLLRRPSRASAGVQMRRHLPARQSGVGQRNLFALQRKTWANIAGIQRSDNN